MTHHQPTISYDEFMPRPREERIGIFNKISAENRALLVVTHVGRWLSINRPRLSREQIAVVQEIVGSISPAWYDVERRDFEKIAPQIEALQAKAEAVLSPEDVIQLLSDRPEYIPPSKLKRN